MQQKIIKKFATGVSVGTGIGMLVFAVLVFLMSAALVVGNVPAMLISPVTVVFLAIGSFFGGFASARLFGEKGFVCGIVSGTFFYLFAWIMGAFFESAGFGTAAIIKAVMIIVSASLGGIIGVNYIKRK